MRVVHLSTYDLKGGAARAAFRLHRGLLEAGVNSSMLVRRKSSDDPAVQVADLDQTAGNKRRHKQWRLLQSEWIDANRTAVSNTHFSVAYPGWDVSSVPVIREADVIHLHWTWWFVGIPGLVALSRLGKPIVWTFHDQRGFTGGCHFSAGCCGYETTCPSCPQLREDLLGITRATVLDSIAAFASNPMTLVCPSRWLASCAQSSAAFRNAHVQVIPYGLNEKIFHAAEKQTSRARFALPAEPFCFLLGADNTAEKRKGFGTLVKALHAALENRTFREAVAEGRVRFLSFGAPRSDLPPEFPVPITAFGRIDSEDELAALYASADVFLLPSLEDNLPNVLLESMACGTPVIAYHVGGIPDVVQDGVNGLLTSPSEPARFANAMIRLWGDPPLLLRLSEQARNVRDTHTLAAQAAAHLNLYESLGTNPNRAAASPGVCPFLEPGPRLAALFPELLATARKRQRSTLLRRLFGGRADVAPDRKRPS